MTKQLPRPWWQPNPFRPRPLTPRHPTPRHPTPRLRLRPATSGPATSGRRSPSGSGRLIEAPATVKPPRSRRRARSGPERSKSSVSAGTVRLTTSTASSPATASPLPMSTTRTARFSAHSVSRASLHGYSRTPKDLAKSCSGPRPHPRLRPTCRASTPPADPLNPAARNFWHLTGQ